MKKIYFFIIGLLICLNSQSQVSQIIDPSMYGGKFQGYAKNSSCVLVATHGGIFRTIDGGISWTNATQNFDPTNVRCRNIVSLDNDFYAYSDNGNIYQSSNNGVNWTQLSFSSSSFYPNSFSKLGDSLYCMGQSNNYLDNNSEFLYSSKDGSTWTKKAKLTNGCCNNGNNTGLYSFEPNKLYIILRDTLFYTTDGNIIDTVSFNGIGKTAFNGDHNGGIGEDVLGNLYLYGGNSIYKYNFITKIWADIASSKMPSGFSIMDASFTDHAIFMVLMNQQIGLKFMKSTDQGSTFTEITNTGLVFPLVQNIVEISTNRFIGNDLFRQILYSTDGGMTWSSSANQYIASTAANLTHSGNSLLFSQENKGITLSNKQGVDWISGNNGIPGFGGIAYFVDDLIQVKDTLFSMCRPNPNSELDNLYKSSDHGASWNACPIPAPYTTGSQYWIAGKCDSALFVDYLDTVSSKYALIVSYNNGKTWTKANSQNSTKQIYIKGNKNRLFAFYQPDNTNDGFDNVYKVSNWGASITSINNGNMFTNNGLRIKRLQNAKGNASGPIMDVDPGNNIAIFATTNLLYVYNMSLNSWNQINSTGLPFGYVANCIKFIGDNIWLLATNNGLYKSTNAGVNWSLTFTNTSDWQNGIDVNSIQMIGNKAFLGTLNNGIWVVDLAFDFGVGFTASQFALNSPPFDFTFKNNTLNKSNFKFTWDFGDGTTTSSTIENNISHIYLYNGTYTVKLTAIENNTGFTDTHTEVDYIICKNGTPDTCFTPVILQGSSKTICGNDSIKLSVGNHKGYTYQWTLNGYVQTGKDSIYYAQKAGDYQVQANNGGCNRISKSFSLMTYPVKKPIIYSTGNINACTGDSMKLLVTPSFKKYAWSTGKTDTSIYIKKSQEYFVSVTDNNNCKIVSYPYNANYSILNIPSICIVTVDSSNFNKIIWEKPLTKQIKSYNIYKESSSAGTYNLIGNVPYEKMSTFTDKNSAPTVHSDRYKLTAIDTCENESGKSNHHRTLHLSVAKNGSGNGYQLIWLDSYEGFTFYMYYIFRGTNKSDLVVIDSIPNTTFTYTDTVSKAGKYFYCVAAVKPGDSCKPTGLTTKGVFPVDFKGANYSVSNIDAFGLNGIENYNESMNLKIYPNPTTDRFTISFDHSNSAYYLEILNTVGQVILNKKLTNNIEQIDLTGRSAGIYFVKIQSANNTIVKKIIKQN